MKSRRGWYLTTMVLLLAAAGQLRAQPLPGTPDPGPVQEQPAVMQPAPGAGPFGGPLAMAPSSIPGLGPPGAQAAVVPLSQMAPQAYEMPGLPAAQPFLLQEIPGYHPGAHPAAFHQAGYSAPQHPPAPQPFPGQEHQPPRGCYDCNGYGCPACAGHACGVCGGYGCEFCQSGLAGGMLSDLLDRFLPFDEGGRCAPRWYDITLEGMYIEREDVSRRVEFTSDGINGDIVLSTDNMDFDEELGMRLTAAFQLFAGLNAELTYFGLFNWTTAAVVSRNDLGDFYSVYSDFGQSPLSGFDETDRSAFQRITYSSELENFEINFRKRWTGPNCRVQGSWLAGLRYVYLLEDFIYDTTGGDDLGTPGVIEVNGTSETLVTARNSLTGFQLGGDLWTAVVPGVLFGGEAKAGVYGNYANQTTTIFASTTAPAQASTFVESDDINDIAMVAEASLQFIYRISPNWSIRAAYNFLFLESIALAPENFNTFAPPNLQGAGARSVISNDNGNAFYYGGSGGIEFMW